MKKVLAYLKRITPLRISMLIAVVFAAAHLIIDLEVFEFGPLSKKGFIRLLDYKALDLKFITRGTNDLPEPKVVVAAMDEKSIERYGWPFSRRVIADLITTLNEGGAKVITFDVVFTDPDKNSSYLSVKRFLNAYEERLLTPESTLSKEVLAEIAASEKNFAETRAAIAELDARIKNAPIKNQVGEIMEKLRRAQERGSKNTVKARTLASDFNARAATFYDLMNREVATVSPDEALAQALAKTKNTILGYFFLYDTRQIEGLSRDQLEASRKLINPSAIPGLYRYEVEELGAATVERFEALPTDFKRLQVASAPEVRPPLPIIAQATPHFAYFNVEPDPDGPLRRQRLLHKFQGQLYPSLGLKTAALYYGGPIYPLENPIFPEVRVGEIHIGNDNLPIPSDMHGRLLINWYADPQKYFPTFSIADILDGTVKPDAYKDKVVFVGATGIGTFDLRVTAFSGDTPGVYTHAQIVQNVIDQRFLERPFEAAFYEILGFLLLGLIFGLAVPRVPALAAFAGTMAFGFLLYIVDVKFVLSEGFWMVNVLPTLQAFFSFAAIVLYSFLTEGREKRAIRNAFQFYLNKSVVDTLVKDPSRLKLGGERRDCTVFFSDVRGFTTISEKLSPEDLVHLLNDYLTPMTDLILKSDGTVDKYIGDAIMAFWNAPLEQPDHATRACYTSLDMMETLVKLRADWKARGMYSEIDVGIGLNSGPMVIGNMGASNRFNYTAMGDTVNLGSRLEGINKEYGTNIIISEFTYERAKNDVYVREMDLVKVKGKLEPVRIYELLGKGKQPSPEHATLIDAFAEAMALYRAAKWDEALALFQRIHTSIKPGDGASETYIERCQILKAEPPADWTGVWTMTSK